MANKRAARGRSQQLSYVPEEVVSAVRQIRRKYRLVSMAAAYRKVFTAFCKARGITNNRLFAASRVSHPTPKKEPKNA